MVSISVWSTSLRRTRSTSGPSWTASGGASWCSPPSATGPGRPTPGQARYGILWYMVYGIWYMVYGIWYGMVWYGMVWHGPHHCGIRGQGALHLGRPGKTFLQPLIGKFIKIIKERAKEQQFYTPKLLCLLYYKTLCI